MQSSMQDGEYKSEIARLSFAAFLVIDDIGADSLDVVELIMTLEDTYGITISDEEAANLVTVRKIVDFLEHLQ